MSAHASRCLAEIDITAIGLQGKHRFLAACPYISANVFPRVSLLYMHAGKIAAIDPTGAS